MLTHIGTNEIETERLILRRFEHTDDEAMLKYWIADEKNTVAIFRAGLYNKRGRKGVAR